VDLYEEFFALIHSLNSAHIRYAVVGGIAVSFYAVPRYTKEIDVLLYQEDIEKVREILHALGFYDRSKALDISRYKYHLASFFQM